MFKDGTIFSLVSDGQGDVLALTSSSQERDTWKGKVEVMNLRCTYLQKELVALQEEVKIVNSLNIGLYVVLIKLCTFYGPRLGVREIDVM